jgi:hypothetical protein
VADEPRVSTTDVSDDIADIDELIVDAPELAGEASCWRAWGTAAARPARPVGSATSVGGVNGVRVDAAAEAPA